MGIHQARYLGMGHEIAKTALNIRFEIKIQTRFGIGKFRIVKKMIREFGCGGERSPVTFCRKKYQ
jgi:hypothetical protein